MKFLEAAIVCLFVSCLAACSMGGIVSISEPNVVPPGVAGADLDASGVLRLNDLSLSVKPVNAKVGMMMVGPIIPIVPLGSGNELGKNQAFSVIVQFDTTQSEFTYVAGETTLQLDGSTIPVSTVSNAMTVTEPGRELARAARGHTWVCRRTKATADTEPAIAQVVPAGKSCFALNFGVGTVGPGRTFRVELRGLKRSGIPVELPTLEFRPGTTTTFTLMG
jgi:hypothetical protein